jgi:hypothetical protein
LRREEAIATKPVKPTESEVFLSQEGKLERASEQAEIGAGLGPEGLGIQQQPW